MRCVLGDCHYKPDFWLEGKVDIRKFLLRCRELQSLRLIYSTRWINSKHPHLHKQLHSKALASTISWALNPSGFLCKHLGQGDCWLMTLLSSWRYGSLDNDKDSQWSRKCSVVSSSFLQSWQSAFTWFWLNAARLLCKIYVPVSKRNFVGNLWISCVEFWTLLRDGCIWPLWYCTVEIFDAFL